MSGARHRRKGDNLEHEPPIGSGPGAERKRAVGRLPFNGSDAGDPITASAMVAAIGDGAAFSKGRDFAAWLGLVPKQISTGDRTILGVISRRDNRYLRTLFVQAPVLFSNGPMAGRKEDDSSCNARPVHRCAGGAR
jgi:Transposase IS116/IS110/IS902 family